MALDFLAICTAADSSSDRNGDAPSTVTHVSHAANTVGGVIRPGQTVMSIVLQRDALSVEVRIAPKDIRSSRRWPARAVAVQFAQQGTYAGAAGHRGHVGADLPRELSTSREFFLARIEVNPQAMAKAEGFKLTPGMPVDGFIETDERTALSHLLKPFTDQVVRAMRE